MNNLAIAVKLASGFQIKRYQDKGQDKFFAEALVLLPPTKDSDPPTQFKAITWQAEKIQQSNPQPGSHLLLTGRIKIDKDQATKAHSVVLSFYHFAVLAGPSQVNSLCIIGRAGQDPDIKYFESGKSVCTLSLAVNRKSKDDVPDWFPVELWNKPGQIVADYVRKGNLLGVTGSLEFEHWTDRATGVPRSKPVAKGQDITLLRVQGQTQEEDEGF